MRVHSFSHLLMDRIQVIRELFSSQVISIPMQKIKLLLKIIYWKLDPWSLIVPHISVVIQILWLIWWMLINLKVLIWNYRINIACILLIFMKCLLWKWICMFSYGWYIPSPSSLIWILIIIRNLIGVFIRPCLFGWLLISLQKRLSLALLPLTANNVLIFIRSIILPAINLWFTLRFISLIWILHGHSLSL